MSFLKGWGGGHVLNKLEIFAGVVSGGGEERYLRFSWAVRPNSLRGFTVVIPRKPLQIFSIPLKRRLLGG